MRHLVRVLVAVTSLLTALALTALPSAAGGGGTAGSDSAYVQQLLYSTSMNDFTTIAAAHTGPDGSGGDTWFDWSNDLCSAPLVGNTGRSFNFSDACRRHDFGYRNTKRLDQRYGGYWNSDSRKRIDQQFLADMRSHCKHRRLIDRPTCHSWAYTFYRAVRVAGGP
ncbi:MAG: phospholipase A2 [Ilumatobacteraceae bacterium]